MPSLREKISSGKFVITSEITLPNGPDLKETFEKAEILRPCVDAINVIDSARAVMRVSPLAVCRLLQERNLEAVCQIACRDKNVIGLESDLLGAWALGVKNILALTGDPVQFGDHANAKKVFELESVKLLELIQKLNSGKDFNDSPLNAKTDFFAGATFNPLVRNYSRTKAKIANCARFFQTQAVFEPEKYIAQFTDLQKFFKKNKIAVLPSIMPLYSVKHAKFLSTKVPGIKVPEKLIQELEASSNPRKTGLEIAKRIIEEVKPFAHGLHFVPLWHEEVVAELV